MLLRISFRDIFAKELKNRCLNNNKLDEQKFKKREKLLKALNHREVQKQNEISKNSY